VSATSVSQQEVLTRISKKWCSTQNMESFSILERVAVRYGVLQGVAARCSVL